MASVMRADMAAYDADTSKFTQSLGCWSGFHAQQMIKAVKQSGVHFIPVGSVSGKGYFSINEWFRKQLEGIGLPVLTGNIKNLIRELRKQLA